MNKIIFPLKPGTKGPQVADLQDALQLCLDRDALLASDKDTRRKLSAALKTERLEPTYGDGTQKLVASFQKERGLQARGEVNEPTANALNALLKEWGLLEPGDQSTSYVVSGAVRREDGKPLSGLTVRAFDQDPKTPDNALGQPATTDAQGRYAIPFSDQDFKVGGKVSGGPDVFVRVSAGSEGLGESRVHRNAGKRITIDITVSDHRPPARAHAFRVSGLVSGPDRRPRVGVTVRAVDQGLRISATLAEGKTAKDGRYDLGYDVSALLDPKKGSASLVVTVLGADDAITATSQVRFNARHHEIVDLIANLEAGGTEWEQIETLLPPALQGAKVTDLTENQLAFLAKSTGLPIEQLTSRAKAASAAAQSRLPEWFHYALLRKGLPVEMAALVAMSEASIRAALAAAQTACIVPAPSDKDVAALWKRLEILQTDHALDQTVAGRQIKVRDVLEVAGLKPATQRALATALGTRDLQTANAWMAVQAETGLDERTIQRVRFTLRTAEIAHDHLPTVAAVQRDKRIQSMRDLARHYDLNTWQALVKETSAKNAGDLPTGIEGGTPAARRASFARQLYDGAASAYPTVAVAYGLSRRKELAKNPAARLLPRIADLDEGFDLASVRIDAYLKDHAGALKIPKAEQANVAEGLKGVQRLYRLKPDTAVVGRFLNDKLDSAAAILRKGRNGFVAEYGRDNGFGRDTAVAIYRQAETTAAKAFALYAYFSPTINTLNGPLVAGGCPDELKALPHYAALFGSLDGCECEPCESVYSPAAYLVDLLAFLKTGIVRDPNHPNAGRVPANGLAALDLRSFCNGNNQLVSDWARRPDIVNTLLSCRNAETLVPYVDLVLEVLENAVAPQGDAALQTTLRPDQLSAQPEHFNEAAYTILSKAVFPFDLPFDLSHKEETAYLDHLGTSRGEIGEVLFTFRLGNPLDFPNGDPHDLTEIRRWQDADVAKARLGLNDTEWALIAGEPLSPPRFVSETWGYPAGNNNWWHALRNVDTLLRRSGLAYKDLLRLFKLKSFNPAGVIGLRDADAGACDPKAMELKGLDANALTFLSRMLRLQRALGWSLRDIDHALMSLAPPVPPNRPVLDGPFLVRLSQAIRLQQKFGLPLEEILSWWSPLDTANRAVPQLSNEPDAPCLFDRLFLSGRSGEDQFEAFELNAARTELADTVQLLDGQRAAIGSALRLPPSELTDLIERTIGGTAPLDLANLSRLYRHASLARALGLRIGDYLIVSALIGIDPFGPAALSPSETLDRTLQSLRFVHRVEAVKASGVSIPELDYLLRQSMPFVAPTVAPAPDWGEAGLTTLEHGLTLVDPFDVVRKTVSQAIDLLGPGPATTAPADRLGALIHEALAQVTALGPDSGGAALTTALTDAGAALVGTPVIYSTITAKFAAITAMLDGFAATFLEQSLRPQLGEDLAGLLKVTPAVSKELLDHLPLPSDATVMAGDAFLTVLRPVAPGGLAPAISRPALIELLVRLHKVAQVVDSLAITAPELARILGRNPAAGWLDLKTLPVRAADAPASFDAWKRLVALLRFRDELPADQQPQLFTLFDIAAQYQAGVTPHAGAQRRAYIGALSTLSGWRAGDVDALVGRWDFGEISHGAGGMLQATFPAHFADERLPMRVLAAIRLLKRLGSTASDVDGWMRHAATLNVPASVRVERIKNVLKARYGAGWPQVAKPLHDPLREHQRHALVAYLVQNWGLARADDLFDHFLIDVEMSPCMMTSRLIQATASVQLFVQRVLLNLEPGLMMHDEAVEQWDWMKNYRVWEANRKIFLYPENWIEPELRDDKTPFFKAFEREILQADITNETAETALLHYLQSLHDVAGLQICGQYLEIGNPSVLHVFGRTRDIPHHYYYRRGSVTLDVEGAAGGAPGAADAGWTPWERVDVDVEGDHLIPIVYNRRVYLFWPIFMSQDEAPMTRTFQSILTLVGKLVKLLMQIGSLIQGLAQGMGVAAIGATTNSIVRLLEGFDNLTIAGVDIVDLGVAINDVRQVRTDLLGVFGIDTSASNDDTAEMIEAAKLPDLGVLQTIADTIKGILESYEEYLISFLPAKRLEVQLAWSEYRYDSWSAKKTSANVVSFRDVVSMMFENLPDMPGLGRQGVRRLFTFRADVDVYNQLRVRCAVALPASLLDAATYGPLIDTALGAAFDPETGRPTWLTTPVEIGHFRVNTCSGQLDAVDTSEDIGFEAIFSQVANQLLDMGQNALQVLRSDRQLLQAGAPVTPDDDPVRPSSLRLALDHVPMPHHYLPPYAPEDVDTYRVLARHQTTSVWFKTYGFFYQDSSRTFLCSPWSIPAVGTTKARDGYLFFPFYHPYTCALLENIQRAGVAGIYQDRYVLTAGGRALPAPSGQPLQVALRNDDVLRPPEYTPVDIVYNPPDGPRALRPIEEINFSTIGAFSQYNWEIFFHVPLLIASRLSTNQKFREAQQWFHHIFNPTDASRGSVPEKYWRTRPFVERSAADYAAHQIDELMQLLNAEAEQPHLQELEWAVRKWRNDAFNPHLIARTRTTAFQKTVVMKYIDNLIAWGDSLFRRETREGVNEAMQLYILAAKLLGPRPRQIPKSAARIERTFKDLEPALDAFSNALVAFENYLPADGAGLGVGRTLPDTFGRDYGRRDLASMAPVGGAWRDVVLSPSMQNVAANAGDVDGLYFCVPPNDKLLAKWDLVADRLFKIRHCRNIEGGALQLPWLSPPIDPAILERAKAMGVDMDSVLNDLYTPMPHYRFQVVLQKATELCGEVKSLGGALLSALEKRDGEALSLLRHTQERSLLEAVQTIKEKQIAESKQAVEGLKRSQESASLRQAHYQRLVMEFMNPEEIVHLELGAVSLQLQRMQFGAKMVSAAASLIPNIKGGFVTTLGATYGGENIGFAAERASDGLGHLAGLLSALGGLISTMGGYRRRADDWLLQSGLAAKEHQGLAKQIAAAEIRQSIAESDLENHKLQISHNESVQAFMQSKFTSHELYDWMVGEVASLHFQTYQMAYELARQSEMTWSNELGVERPGIIKPGYWVSLKKGLLAGEHLHHDLKRLDVTFLNRNAREYELTKLVSLRQVDPLALLELRATGRCNVTLPEALFDMDAPGHYFRRIKTVAVSIPCIVGPYVGVNCTLTLLRSGIRRDPSLAGGTFVPQLPDTDRFQSIVTSSSQSDSGLLETNLHDERYLPFENAGVISEWQLELPAHPGVDVPRQFDYDTISDVILHVRYTAREGGELLRTAAAKSLNTLITGAAASGSMQLFSLRHDFPTEWARFQAQTPAPNDRFEIKVALRAEHYPFWSQGRLNTVTRMGIVARSSAATPPASLDIFDKANKNDATARKESLSASGTTIGLPTGTLNGGPTGIVAPVSPIGELSLFLDDRALADLWLLVSWSD